jgi:ABC-type phosphonate transport system ATPase subunit
MSTYESNQDLSRIEQVLKSNGIEKRVSKGNECHKKAISTGQKHFKDKGEEDDKSWLRSVSSPADPSQLLFSSVAQ